MLVIGSSAMAWHGLARHSQQKVLDIDVIAYPEELDMFYDCDTIEKSDKKVAYESDSGIIFEVEIANPGTNQEMLLNLLDVNPDHGFTYAPKEVLYALKMSHRFLKNSPHFIKTMQDIHQMREKWSVNNIAPYLREWYDRRVKETYVYDHPKLNQSKDNFFNEDIFDGKQVYVYDHDTLHEVVKLFDKPAYTYFLDGPVKVSKEKFYALDYETQLASVVEEAMVLSLERAIIPLDTPQHRAFAIAIEKVCTSIASGWWRDFAWENYLNAIKLYQNLNKDLKKDLQQGLDEGIVKPFKHEVNKQEETIYE